MALALKKPSPEEEKDEMECFFNQFDDDRSFFNTFMQLCRESSRYRLGDFLSVVFNLCRINTETLACSVLADSSQQFHLVTSTCLLWVMLTAMAVISDSPGK